MQCHPISPCFLLCYIDNDRFIVKDPEIKQRLPCTVPRRVYGHIPFAAGNSLPMLRYRVRQTRSSK